MPGGLHIYYFEAEVHGVIFFSSRVYPAGGKAGGTVEEAAPIIHNYALTYAVNGLPAEAYGMPPSLHYASFRGGKGGGRLEYPFIERVIKCIVNPSCSDSVVYAYPAAPMLVRAQKFFTAIRTHSYGEYRGSLKTVFPRSVTLVGLAPGSRLNGFLASTTPLPGRLYARLGMKRAGMLMLRLTEAKVVGRLDEPEYTSHPVNVGDTAAMGYEVEDAIVVLETRSAPFLGGRPCHGCARVGYVRARGLYEVEYRAGRSRRALLPLPPARLGAAPARERHRVEPAWQP